MKVLPFFLLSALLFSCKTSPKKNDFTEGSITYKITYDNVEEDIMSLMADRVELKLKKDKMYLKVHGGLAEIKPPLLIDMKRQELLYPNYLDSTVLPKAISSLDYGKSFDKVGKGETINGYTTTRYRANYGERKYTIDAADDIPVHFENAVIMEGFYLSAFDKLPLKVMVSEPGFSYSFKAENIETASLPDTIFEVPRGFRIKRP
jgi:hypothetical protein